MRPSRSPDRRRLLVAAYDLVDDRRRERVARVLEDYGTRVQYSVFECRVAHPQYRQLREELDARIDLASDAVAFYRLCSRCGERVRRIGKPPPDPSPQFLIF
jgi:CRISPR-associated protein Cas2